MCRYAHAIYELRYRDFTYRDAGMYCSEYESGRGATSKAFKELISDSAEFDFNMEDIARFRDEFKTLIEKLSGIYLKMKNAEKLLEQEQKRQQRKVTDEAPPSLAAKIETKPVSASSERERSVDAPVNLETHMYGGSSNQEFMIDRVRASTSRTIGRKDKENFKDWMGSKLVLELGGPFDRLEYASGNHAVQEERHDYTAMEDKSQYDDSLNVLNI